MTKVEYIRSEFTRENQAELWMHVNDGLTASQIAEEMGKPYSTITFWCERLNLEPRKMTRKEIDARHRARQAVPKQKMIQPIERATQKPNPMQEAELYLGKKRLQERNGQYYLDGRPTGLNGIIRATNTILKANGSPQLDANPAWVVS